MQSVHSIPLYTFPEEQSRRSNDLAKHVLPVIFKLLVVLQDVIGTLHA